MYPTDLSVTECVKQDTQKLVILKDFLKKTGVIVFIFVLNFIITKVLQSNPSTFKIVVLFLGIAIALAMLSCRQQALYNNIILGLCIALGMAILKVSIPMANKIAGKVSSNKAIATSSGLSKSALAKQLAASRIR